MRVRHYDGNLKQATTACVRLLCDMWQHMYS